MQFICAQPVCAREASSIDAYHCSTLLLLHLIMCHSKKCHRPRTSCHKEQRWNRIRVIPCMHGNICLNMRSSSYTQLWSFLCSLCTCIFWLHFGGQCYLGGRRKNRTGKDKPRGSREDLQRHSKLYCLEFQGRIHLWECFLGEVSALS